MGMFHFFPFYLSNGILLYVKGKKGEKKVKKCMLYLRGFLRWSVQQNIVDMPAPIFKDLEGIAHVIVFCILTGIFIN